MKPPRVTYITRALLLALAGAHIAAPANAQSSKGKPDLPREFVDVLLSDAGSAEMLPGKLPVTLPAADALARDTRVVGSIVGQQYSETALALRETEPRARALLEGRLRAAGWTEQPSTMPQPRGFLRAPDAEMMRAYCRSGDDTMRLIMSLRAAASGSYVILRYERMSPGAHCSATPDPSRPIPGLERELPVLRPPQTVQFISGSSSGSGEDYEMRTTVISKVSPAQFVTHFEPQLTAQGWTPVEQLRGNALAQQYARKPDGSGESLLLWVSVTDTGNDRRQLAMRIMKVFDPK